MFGSSRNSADLLAIIDNQIIAIEIKSKDDNLKRLPHQIEEYSKVYDKIIVFCSQDKIDETKKSLTANLLGYTASVKIPSRSKKCHESTFIQQKMRC